jgi:hypothetical protein
VCAERVGTESVEVASQSTDARQNLHRRKIKIRTLPSPGLHNGVDLVASRLAGHNRSLDVKSLDVEI